MLAVLLALAVVLEVMMTMAAAAAISASFLLTTTDKRSSRGSYRCICITFSSCGQFSSHRIECWRGPSLKLKNLKKCKQN